MTRSKLSRPAIGSVNDHVDSVGTQNEPATRLSMVSIGLVSAILVASQFITGDSVSVAAGETLPLVLMILLSGLVAGLAGWQFVPLHKAARGALLLIIVALALLTVSSMAATWRADGRAAWNSYWHLLAMLCFALLVRQVASRAVLARALTLLLLACALFQSTYAVHQYFISMPATRAEYLRDPDAAMRKAQIDAPPGSELRGQYESRLLGSFEPIGTFALTNSLAVLLSSALVASFIVGLAGYLSRHSSHVSSMSAWQRFGSAAALLIVAAAWMLTKSRSGYLAVGLVSLPMAWVTWRRWRYTSIDASTLSAAPDTTPSTAEAVLSAAPRNMSLSFRSSPKGWLVGGVGIGLVVLAGIALLASDSLVLTESLKSFAFRLEYWQAAARMIVDYAWTGVGFGNFQSYYPQYKVPAASEIIADPHNWLLDIAAMGSVPLLLVVLLGLGWCLQRSISIIGLTAANETAATDSVDKQSGRERTWFWSGAAIAFCVILIMQLFTRELIDFQATVLAVVVTVAALICLRGWQPTLGAMRLAALAAVLTMLTCWLASGCWQASGLALPLVAWLAICHPACQPATAINRPLNVADSQVNNAVGSRPQLGQVIIMLLALAAFWIQTWGSVQNSWVLEQTAMDNWQNGNVARALDLTEQAIASDSLSSSGQRLMAQFRAQQVQAAADAGSADDFRAGCIEFDEAIERLIAANRVSYLNWSFAGEATVSIAARALDFDAGLARSLIERGLGYYTSASERYPSSVALHAQRAVLLAWLKQTAGSDQAQAAAWQTQCQAALAEARAMSEITPHANRQLHAQQVWLPPPLAAAFPASAVVRPADGTAWVKAEPLCDFLRSNSQPNR